MYLTIKDSPSYVHLIKVTKESLFYKISSNFYFLKLKFYFLNILSAGDKLGERMRRFCGDRFSGLRGELVCEFAS